MTTRIGCWRTMVTAAIVMIVAAAAAVAAQVSPAPPGPPNALQGFSQNQDQPVKIEATTLEVRDKSKVATFLGDVHMTQGDTTMKCKTLVVFYEENAAPGALPAAQPGPSGQQQIRRLEAKGGVVVTQKDQTATGDSGLFDMKTNTMTLLGNVVVTQGQNVVRGDRLVVDMTTGVSRVESGKTSRGRVEGLFVPGTQPGSAPGGAHDGKPATGSAKDAPKPAPPLKVN